VKTVNVVRDPLDRWLTGSAAGVAMLGVACTLIAASASVWFNRVVVNPEHKFADGLIYSSRSFTLNQLADGAHNPGRFGDAETLLLIGSIILTGAVTALIVRSHLRARAGASAAMVIGFLLIGWGLELAKSPLPSRPGFPIAILWETGAPGLPACEGTAACEAAAVLGLLGALFAALAWGRARWFRQRWMMLEPKSEEGMNPKAHTLPVHLAGI
jgi:hypothetical protein